MESPYFSRETGVGVASSQQAAAEVATVVRDLNLAAKKNDGVKKGGHLRVKSNGVIIPLIPLGINNNFTNITEEEEKENDPNSTNRLSTNRRGNDAHLRLTFMKMVQESARSR